MSIEMFDICMRSDGDRGGDLFSETRTPRSYHDSSLHLLISEIVAALLSVIIQNVVTIVQKRTDPEWKQSVMPGWNYECDFPSSFSILCQVLWLMAKSARVQS